MSRLEIMIRVTLKKAVEGDTRAFQNTMRWAEVCGAVAAEPPPETRQQSGVITQSEYERLYGPIKRR